MTRWIRGIIWVTGSCVLSCPFSVCMSGGGSWWVCACTVGLLSVTVISGYATWSIISHILNDSSTSDHFLSRLLTFKHGKNNGKESSSRQRSNSTDNSSFLEKEIFITAQAFHSHLVLPWYSYISPDDKYSLQIRSTLEDLLTGVFKNLKQHTNVSVLFQHILTLYIQHYRQFYKALKKVSQKLNVRPVDCVTHMKEIQECYKPIHNALRSEDGIHLHSQRLAHLLLINYLPTEISRCNLLFLCLKDLFAQNILKITLDMFCDTQWLNETLVDALEPVRKFECNTAEELKSDICTDENKPKETKDEKIWRTIHSLSAIREETSLEVLDNEDDSWVYVDFANNFHGTHERQKKSVVKTDGFASTVKDSSRLGATASLDFSEYVEKTENTHALLKYVQQSSSLDKISETKGCVATVLGDLISTTAVPLLPEVMTFPAVHTKMWESPQEEEKKPVTRNLLRKNIIEGLTETDYKEKMKQAPSGVSSFLEKQVLGTGASKKCPCYPGDLLNTLDLQRSKSLSNLPSKSDSNDDEEKFNSTKNLSCSSEALPRLWSSADDAAQTELSEDNPISKKAKACLTKMDSFDKSDGYDEFSFDYFAVGTDTTLHFENNNSGMFCQSLSSSHSPTEFKSSSTIEPTEPEKRIVTSPMSMSSSSSTLAGDDQPQKTRSILDLPLSPSSKESDKEFGWENPIPDLSPIYEESENLASTIAKLRCLLSERQSQHSLGSQSSFGSSESEPKSAQSDPGRYSLERSRFTFFHKDSSSSLASAKSSSSTDSAHPQWFAEEEISEASEGVSVDGKVFVSVSIPTTEVHSEAAGFQYTMYIIQYDAIYLCEVVSSTGLKDGASDLSQVSDHKMVLQTNIVKRRFREFLSLQSALEEDPLLRASMKGVKGPNKWLNLPFSKLDSATISSRRQFLEKYLQALILRSPINTSAQLKDFLAYGSDSSISFVKKPLEINIPRLDKLLARTVSGVSGVFHSIKTALPNFDSADVSLQESLGASSICMSSKGNIHLMAADVTPTKVSPSVEKDRQDYLKDYDVQLDITAEEQVCELEGSLLTAITATSELSSPMDGVSESRILNLDNTGENILANTSAVPFLPTSSCDLLSVNQGMEGETGSKQSSPYSCKLNPLTSFWAEIGVSTSRVHPLQRQESQDSFGTGESDTDSSHPLFLSLVDALVEIVGSTDHPITRQGATLLITRLWAQPITHFLQSELDKILSEDLFQVFFNRLRFCIGNSGRGVDEAEGTSLELESQDLFKERLQQSKKDLERVLRKYIPSSLELMLGSESLRDSLTLFIESLQHPPLNRDFGLHLIDLIFVHLLLPV